MLNFARPVKRDERIIGFRDHSRPDHVYLLPGAVDLWVNAAGDPLFSLCLYAGQHEEGGRLSLQLYLDFRETEERLKREESPAARDEFSYLPVERAWLRLRLRTPLDLEGGAVSTPWYEFQVKNNRLAGVALPLEKDLALLLENLLMAEDLPVDALQAEVRLAYRGLRSVFPVTCTVVPYLFYRAFLSQIEGSRTGENTGNSGEGRGESPGESLTDLDQLEITTAAARAIIRAWIDKQPGSLFKPGDIPQTPALIDEVLERIYEKAFIPKEKDRCTLRPLSSWEGLPPADSSEDREALKSVKLQWDLRVPVAGERWWFAQWRFSEFWQGLAREKQGQLFTRIPVPEPLQPVPIYITNNIPLDLGNVRKIVVKLHYYGTSQDWEDHEVVFADPGDVSCTCWAIKPRSRSFSYYYGLEAYFWPPPGGGWPPAPLRLEMTGSKDPYLPVTPAAFQLDFLNLVGQGDAFDHIGAVEVQLLKHLPGENRESEENGENQPVYSLRLEESDPVKQVVIRKDRELLYHYYRILVHPPQEVRALPVETLAWTPLEQGRLLITAYHTQVIKPDTIRLFMQATESFHPLFILVWLKGGDESETIPGELIKLDRENTGASWAVWRKHLFAGIRYQWRAEIYWEPGTGLTPFMTGWQTGSRQELRFDTVPGGDDA